MRILHPFPTLMNALAAGLFGWIASGYRIEPFTLFRLAATMLAIQSCIGAVNDLSDFELDRATRPDKPLVDGSISLFAARVLAISLFVVAVLLSTLFGFLAFLLAMAGLACGLAYDLWLKRTPASLLPYMLALPLFPLWVWIALKHFQPALWLVIPIGFALALALHLANALPDAESDAAAGVDGLAQRLGRRKALATCWASFAIASLLALASGLLVSHRLGFLIVGVLVAVLGLALALLIYALQPRSSSLRAGWVLLVLGSAVLALGWLASL